jgi:acyl carrier protein
MYLVENYPLRTKVVINESTRWMSDLGLDSLDMGVFLIDVERVLLVEISDFDLPNLNDITIGDLNKIYESKLLKR